MTQPWFEEAKKEIGLQERPGGEHEPRVVKLFADSGNSWVKDDETPWCGAFVGAMFKRAGRPEIRPPGEKANALRAREWLNVGQEVWVPREGDIAVFSRGDKNGTQGHVGLYVSENSTHANILGGNQSNSVSIAAYSKDRLLGYRRVEDTRHAAEDRPRRREEDRPAPPAPPPVSPPSTGVSRPTAETAVGTAAVGGAAAAGAPGWLVVVIVALAVILITRRWWAPLFRRD